MFKFEDVRPNRLLELLDYQWYSWDHQLILKGGDWRELSEDEKLEIGDGVVDDRDGDPIPVTEWRSWTMVEDEIVYDLYIFANGKYELMDSMVGMAEEGEWNRFEVEKIKGDKIIDGSTNREIWVMNEGVDLTISEDENKIVMIVDGIIKIYNLVEEI